MPEALWHSEVMVAMVCLLVFYCLAAWTIFWFVPRSLRRSRSEVPSTVPQEWVDEFRDRR